MSLGRERHGTPGQHGTLGRPLLGSAERIRKGCWHLLCPQLTWGRTESSEWDGPVLPQLCSLRQPSGLPRMPVNASWKDKGWDAGLVSLAVCCLSIYLADIYSWPTGLCAEAGVEQRANQTLALPRGTQSSRRHGQVRSQCRPEGPLIQAGRLRWPFLKKGGEEYSREKERNVRMPRGPRAVQSRDCSLVSGEWEWCLKKRTRLHLMGPWQPPHSIYVAYWSDEERLNAIVVIIQLTCT